MTRPSKPSPGTGNVDEKLKTSPESDDTPSLNTNSLNERHNEKCRAMLELVSELKTCGLNSLITLPQLVVCGDQSSGKSSVLEGLTEVPFPCKEGLCTRFATLFENRSDPHESIRNKIVPDSKLPPAEQKRLASFNKTITNFKQFGTLIEEATTFMGLKSKSNKAAKQKGPMAFYLNVLSIEISGPDRLPITIVDLPGLIHTETAEQTEEDKILIHGLVDKYLSEERTIALAVVDPDGHRTLGIITKMDCLPAGCKREKTWLDNLRYLNIKLGLGWHLLKNRSDEEHDQGFAERNQSEAKFFDTGSYKEIRDMNKGIISLRTRISDLLYEYGKDKLPKVRDEAIKKLKKVNASLNALGEKRATVSEQKSLLMNIAIEYHNIVSNAVEGHYEHSFFMAQPESNAIFQDKFLRGATVHLQEQFTRQMLMYGHKFNIPQTKGAAGTDTSEVADLSLDEFYAKAQKYQPKKTREDALTWAELPGTFNSALVARLFHEQSENWESLATEHIDNVEAGCSSLVIDAVSHIAPPEIARNINERLDGILSRRHTNAQMELAKLLVDRVDPVAIYDPSFAMDVQKLLDHEHITRLAEMNELIESNRLALLRGEPPRALEIHQATKKQDSNHMSAGKALDNLMALYLSKVKTFTANVTQQVIERNLLKGLADETLSAAIVHEMSDEEISDLAAEPGHVTRERECLENQKETLEKSRKAFNKVLNPRKLDYDEDYGNAVVGGSKPLRRRAFG